MEKINFSKMIAIAVGILLIAGTVTTPQRVNAQPYVAQMPGPPPSGQCSIWARDYSVKLGGSTSTYMWWSDFGYDEYYIVLYEVYPDGSTHRYPPSGVYGPYPAPGPYRALVGTFVGDVEGVHYLYFQLYAYQGCLLLCTSNTIAINVVKEKKATTITVSVSPSRVERGDSVTVSGQISPGVSAQVTLEFVSSSGRKSTAQVTSTGTGAFSYTFTPDETGRWSVKASWPGDRDYLGASSDWVTFEVESRKYQVTVSVSPPELPFVVDGAQYYGSATFKWDEGSTHNLFVQKVISAQGGVRYVFEKWSDGSTLQSRSVEVTGPATYQAMFSKEYYVAVDTKYGDVSGVGWYKEGDQARIKLETPVVDFGNGTRAVFTGWSGDYRGTDTEVYLRVNNPYTLKASWKTQYRVDLVSDLSRMYVEGGEWQDAGSTVKVSVQEKALGFLVKKVFSGVEVTSGRCTVVSSNLQEGFATVRVEGPCTVRAVWRDDYTDLLLLLGAIALVVALYVAYASKLRRLQAPPPPPAPTGSS